MFNKNLVIKTFEDFSNDKTVAFKKPTISPAVVGEIIIKYNLSVRIRRYHTSLKMYMDTTRSFRVSEESFF